MTLVKVIWELRQNKRSGYSMKNIYSSGLKYNLKTLNILFLFLNKQWKYKSTKDKESKMRKK